MTRYYINCKEVGFQDCTFCTEGDTVEQVIEQCADHGREHHGLRGFGVELYAKMRPHIHQLQPGESAPQER